MIKINGSDVSAIFIKGSAVSSVYTRGQLVWPENQENPPIVIPEDTEFSCYFNGYWLDEYPWTENTPWTD